MYEYLISINHKFKVAAILALDLFLILISIFIAFILRLNNLWPIDWFLESFFLVIIMLSVAVIFTFVLKLHRKKLGSFDFRFATDLVILATSLSFIGFIANIFFEIGAPRTAPIIAGVISYILLLYSRYSIIHLLELIKLGGVSRTPIAIYGAGSAGTHLANSLRASAEYKPILFIDDNPHLHNLNIAGLRIYRQKELKKFVENGTVQEIFLAMPTASLIQRRKTISLISEFGCKISEIPAYEEVIKSGNFLRSLRTVDPDDLLERKKVEIELATTITVYGESNVLISGGGGSIGSELCRQVLETRPNILAILDISELNLFQIENELQQIANELGTKIIPILGSVCDESLIHRVLEENKINTILHAAAYKHVPLIEENIIQGIKNNIFGTRKLAEIAISKGIERFTLVSSDKAVRPSSVMGATKRICELILQDLDSRTSDCIFSIVRFGNVIGSSGSVIPNFKQQIEESRSITVTHEGMTRYFMTISEASQLVLLASSLAKGGEVFALEMGEPIKIIDLAKRVITLSGYSIKSEQNPDGDIEIKIGEIRQGEKLHEERLVTKNSTNTFHPKVLVIKETKLSQTKLNSLLKKIEGCVVRQDSVLAKKILFSQIGDK